LSYLSSLGGSIEDKEKLGPITAIKRFMEVGSSKPVSGRELIDFKNACSEAEYKQYATSAAEQVGAELKPE